MGFTNALVKQDQTLLITGLLYPSLIDRFPNAANHSRVQFETDWKTKEVARPFLKKLTQIGQVQWFPPRLGVKEKTEIILHIQIDDLREAVDFIRKQLGPVLKTKQAK